uniref:Uncharacterized protein n=1 Tax=Elaeophora elaphi TaxID=1147741 RepID=A0A0R3RPS9_9BILA
MIFSWQILEHCNVLESDTQISRDIGEEKKITNLLNNTLNETIPTKRSSTATSLNDSLVRMFTNNKSPMAIDLNDIPAGTTTDINHIRSSTIAFLMSLVCFSYFYRLAL